MEKKNKKKKCFHCSKKLSMINFKCKCGNLYCIAHQLPHVHCCTYNNKDKSKEILKKNLIKVESNMDKKLLKN